MRHERLMLIDQIKDLQLRLESYEANHCSNSHSNNNNNDLRNCHNNDCDKAIQCSDIDANEKGNELFKSQSCDQENQLSLESSKKLNQQIQEDKLLIQDMVMRLREIQENLNTQTLVADSLKLEILELLPLKLKLQEFREKNNKVLSSLRTANEEVHMLKSERDRLKQELQEKTISIETTNDCKATLESKVRGLEKENKDLSSRLEIKTNELLQGVGELNNMKRSIKDLEKERAEIQIQKSIIERKNQSLTKELARLCSQPYMNALEEIKEENSILKSRLQLRDEALETMFNPNKDINDNNNTLCRAFDENNEQTAVADENCFVFLFGAKKKRGKSNIF